MNPATRDTIDGYAVRIAPETVRLERLLPGPVERVWSYVVDPAKRRLWFADGPMDLREGGAVSLIWRHAELSRDDIAPPEHLAKNGGEMRAEGTVTRCEPPHRISFTWALPGDPETEATFELAPRGDNVLLTVTHRRLVTDGLVVGVSTGWHSHLAVLRAQLEGSEPPRFWANFATLRETYRQRYAK